MNTSELTEVFRRAIEWRKSREPRLQNDKEIGRYFAGKPDGLEGVFVDSFGPLVVLTIYNSKFAPQALEFAGSLKNCLAADRGVLVKVRSPSGGFDFVDPENLLGRSWTASEDDCQFEVRADDKNDFGIFPDARPARLLLRSVVDRETSVLNLFSYTCGFAVVACRAGAKAVVNVDASSEMLTWGKRNAALNGVDFAVVPELAQKYLERLQRRVSEGKVDCPQVWVCDPPAFGVGRGQQRILKYFWDDFWRAVEKLGPCAVLVLRNDRTGHRRGNTLMDELEGRLGGRYEAQAVSFAQSPSLCYEGEDAFYKLNESLLLLRR